MKKVIYNTQIILLLFLSVFFKSQDNSLSSSVLTPIANQTGVPDIFFPLASLSAAKDFTLNFGLTYNPNSYKPTQYCGQIARNWMLSGSNFTITRQVISEIDESLPSWSEWDDIYYYNLNGEQGSFMFVKSGVFPNDLHIKKLTPSNLIIEFERVQTTNEFQARPVIFFKISDRNGYKYTFSDYDSQKIIIPGANGSQPKYDMRNVFYIVNITDAKNKQIATFQNKKYIKYEDHSNNTIINAWTYLPKEIITNYGKIIIDHGDSGLDWNLHDRYYFKNFTLLDHNGKFVTKNELNINNGSYSYYDVELFESIEAQIIKVRYLTSIKKIDKKLKVIDETTYKYTYSPPSVATWGSPIPLWTYQRHDFLMNGLLNTVKFSSGAKIEYDFGVHTLKLNPPIDYNTPAYINSIQSVYSGETSPFSFKQKTDSIAFDSHVTKKYYLNNLQKSPNSRIYIKFFKDEIYPWNNNPQPDTKGSPILDPKLAYKVKNYIQGNSQEIEDLYSSGYVVRADANPYLEITGSGGNGWFEIYEKLWSEPPYILLNQNAISDTGVKIEQIKYSDRSSNFTPYDPSYFLRKTITFDYSLFNEPGVSSGKLVLDEGTETVIYKNIKILESDKPGYIKYSYKVPDDYPSYNPSANSPYAIWQPFFNFTKKGVLSSKEIYDANNTKKLAVNIDYTFPPYEVLVPFEENYIPQKVTTNETSNDSQGNTLATNTEKSFNQDNNNLIKDKKTTADGIIVETDYKYAAEKNNTKLLGAGMLSVPLEVTQIQNGVQIGKVETFYDHTGNYFPSSVKSYGINNVLINEEKNDIYDSMGNVLQSSSKGGTSTAYIYGYNGTLLLAKIEGAKYEDVMTAFGQSAGIEAYKNLEIYMKSNEDIDDSSEETLRQKLDEFRLMNAFKNYQITTYTYDPLIGVKSVTSPSGNKEYYYYDDFNRLIRVEDINHNVIKENKYKNNLID
ncbi:hypothetical protein [Kaistella sp.]|uniref:hypothetical protein n=1 Tax=Kaistella sp. TaxID=2782235 RepID=UPI003C3E4671